jgi:hypothetical protein
MIRLNSAVLRAATYAAPLIGLFPLAFGISIGLEKLDRDVTTASRIALVIGNADYPDATTPLRHPRKDARTLADELKRSGFAVDVRENLGKEEMKRALDSFTARIKPGSVALISYAGFGIQVGRQSYMIPVDAQIWKAEDVGRDGVSIESVLSQMHNKGASVKLAVFDASRRNPFERRFRGFSAGLAAIDAPAGTLLLSAAAPGKVAYDGAGEHSLLIGELLKQINAPGISAEAVFNQTRIGVSRASNGEQVPLVSSALSESFAFVGGTPRYTRAQRDDIGEASSKAMPPLQAIEPIVAQDTDATPVRTTPRGDTNKPVSTAKGAPYELASQPKPAPAAKETKAPKVVGEGRRRSLDDVSREIPHERPRAIIRHGGWHSSFHHPESSWRIATAHPRHVFTNPVLGIGY